MYGSDWPVCTLAGEYEAVFNLATWLSKNFNHDEAGSFWAGCAERAYHLSLNND
jgi:L-fuconolactonase